MQAPATGKSLAEGQSCTHLAKRLHKFSHVNAVDDDGSTSAGSSDHEHDRFHQVSTNNFKQKNAFRSGHAGQDGAAALVYCMDVLSLAQEPARSSKTRTLKAKHAVRQTQQQQTIRKPSPPPGLDGFAPPPGLQHTEVFAVPLGFTPPPGLASPLGLTLPPGLELSGTEVTKPIEMVGPYNPKDFHRELVAIFRELSQTTNVAAAVRRVRSQNVPRWHQAAETTDILTRAAEECRGTHRRLFFAFAAGLAKGRPSAFESLEVVSGVQAFFRDVYEDLCEEVPRLPNIVEAELIPTLCAVFPPEVINPSFPARFRVG